MRKLRFRDTAFTYRMPAGIPGDINRAWAATVEPNILNTATPFLTFGLPGLIDTTTGLFRPVAAADTAALTYGLLVRSFPVGQQTASSYSGQQLLTDSTVPPASGPCDVLKRGYMTIHLYGATAAKAAGLVFIRTQNAGAGQIVGGIEAAADGGNTIVMPAGYYFRGPADASGNVEIAWNL